MHQQVFTYLGPFLCDVKYTLLLCDGSAFDPLAFPVLAELYPDHHLPYLHRVAVGAGQFEPPVMMAATK